MTICPVCSSDKTGKMLARVNLVSLHDHDLCECPECGVIRFDPLPANDELEQFYSSSYYDFLQFKEEGNGKAFARKLDAISPKGNLLDIGCATGFFIKGIKDSSDWNVCGVEFGTSAARYARETLRLDVRNCSLEGANFPDGYFDYIRINNVLEHVSDPQSMLRECRRIISPTGQLFLEVPNGFNDSRELIDFYQEEKVPARSKNGHIFFFRSGTLTRLFENCGFKAVSQRTGSLKRGLRNAGYLPRKGDWKKDYYPKAVLENDSREVNIKQGKKYPDIYYRFRQWQGGITRISGLHDYGLDFQFILKPKH